jgi:hypothetical protein
LAKTEFVEICKVEHYRRHLCTDSRHVFESKFDTAAGGFALRATRTEPVTRIGNLEWMIDSYHCSGSWKSTFRKELKDS